MTLRVATDHGVKRNDAWENVTDWHSVVVWRKERLVEYLRKGSRVYVEGRLQTRKYTGKDNVERYSTEIVADNIIVLGNGKGEGDSGQHSADSSRQSASQPAPQYDGPITDDDVPF
jgi:single-strand DNA-binding protein